MKTVIRSLPESLETVKADAVVLALGQNVDLGLPKSVEGLKIENGSVIVDSTCLPALKAFMPAAIWFQEKETLPWLSDKHKSFQELLSAFLNGKRVVVPPKHQIVTFDQLNLLGTTPMLLRLCVSDA